MIDEKQFVELGDISVGEYVCSNKYCKIKVKSHYAHVKKGKKVCRKCFYRPD